MKIINSTHLNEYLKNDWILGQLNQIKSQGNSFCTSDNWLLGSEAKRLIFNDLYYGLFNEKADLRVLDIGAGLSVLGQELFSKIQYEVVDLFHHEKDEDLKKFQSKGNSVVLHQKDWQKFCPEKNKYQIIISNDLFPNVDQRLDEFLEKYIPFAKEIRMSLTYYDVRKTYQVKRVDGDEVFFIRPWNGRQLSEVLRNFQDRIKNPDFDALFQENRSIFANGRQVCMLKIRGDG